MWSVWKAQDQHLSPLVSWRRGRCLVFSHRSCFLLRHRHWHRHLLVLRWRYRGGNRWGHRFGRLCLRRRRYLCWHHNLVVLRLFSGGFHRRNWWRCRERDLVCRHCRGRGRATRLWQGWRLGQDCWNGLDLDQAKLHRPLPIIPPLLGREKGSEVQELADCCGTSVEVPPLSRQRLLLFWIMLGKSNAQLQKIRKLSPRR
mmetsp:Transcript_30880/g.54425  ORF Transcript_30880/g.54425 Transcript_30880/m.54425 type:complete len:200 (+) Transcript_30880:2120-2719(+)